MSWLKVDDSMPENPKIQAVGRDAFLLYLSGLIFASQQLTNGFIPEAQLKILAAKLFLKPSQVGRLAERLATPYVGTGNPLWEPCEGGYMIHDYLEFNPSREKVLQEREAARARMQKNRSGEHRPNIDRSSPSPSQPVPAPTRPISSLARREESDNEAQKVLALFRDEMGVKESTAALKELEAAIGKFSDVDALAYAANEISYRLNHPSKKDPLTTYIAGLERCNKRRMYLRTPASKKNVIQVVPDLDARIRRIEKWYAEEEQDADSGPDAAETA